MSDLTDRSKEDLEFFIDRRTAKYDYALVYSYIVVSQNSNGTIEVQPEDPSRTPPLSSVEIFYDNPATKVTLKKGAICRVRFVNGDPKRPEAFGFKHGDYTLLELGEGGFPLAVQGGVVSVGGVGLVATFAGAGVLTAGTPLPCVLGTVTNPIGGWPGYIMIPGTSKVKGR
jgi:hypothetical protein